jgi:serine/threonine-protein kinase
LIKKPRKPVIWLVIAVVALIVLLIGWVATRPSPPDVIEVAYIPDGEFIMGSEDGNPDETPVHKVYLDAYWIDRTEVTNARFAAVLNQVLTEITVISDRYVNLGYQRIYDLKCFECIDWQDPIIWDGSKFIALPAYQDHPVSMVTWYGAQAYCEWTGRRLPTEAEWEKAARGKKGFIYPWGNEFACQKGNFDDETILDKFVVPGGEGCDGYNQTAPIGSFPDGESPYGVYDMAGNVWEWVSDWYDSDYYNILISFNNPEGPLTGSERALRGGGWYDSDWSARGSSRHGRSPNYYRNYIGFRCAHDATP